MDNATDITGSWNCFKFVSTMVHSILIPLAIVSLNFIQDTSGHGALIEPPMRSVLWKYGFDAPINYNYMELYCGGFQNFQNNGGRCGVCGDSLQGPYENERGGKYDLGIIARSYPEGTTSIEVKVEITAHHKGYFEFKLCPNDEAEVTQECLDRYTLMIEEGIQQGDPMKFYPPGGQTTHSLKVSIPPDIRCERCVLQWTYRAGNRWGTNPDGKSCLGCGMQETFINCADISVRSHGVIVNTRFKSFDSLLTSDQAQSFVDHKDKLVQTTSSRQELSGIVPNNKEQSIREIGTRRQLSKLSGIVPNNKEQSIREIGTRRQLSKLSDIAPNNKEQSIREIGTRRQLSNNITPIPPESQRPIKLNNTHRDQNIPVHTNHVQSHFEKKQVIDSDPSVNHISPIGIIHHDKAVSQVSDKVHEEPTSHISSEWHKKAMLSPRGQDSSHQPNDIKRNELENFLAKLPREVISTTSRKDERQPATVIEALYDTLKPFNATGAGLVKNDVHYDPRLSNSINSHLHSTGWSDPRSVFRPMQSQWTSGNSIVHSRVPFMETVNQLLPNNTSMPQLRFHSAAPHDGMVMHSREIVSQAHLQPLPEQRITASARQRSIASHSQLQTPFQDTAQWINPIQFPVHQEHSLFGQQQLPRISPNNAHLFPFNEIHLANAIHTQTFGTRQPHGIITGLSPDVQARMSLTSSQVQTFYQRLAVMASLNNAHQLSQNIQHASQTPIERTRATIAAIQNLHSAVPNTIHREALIRNTILSDRQSRMDRRFSHGV